jgi:carboxymethylenebutenolidase
VDHYAALEASEKHLDPSPLVKWAEEGFAVCQVMVPGKVEDGGEFPLERAMEVLRGCEGCDVGEGAREGFGVVCMCFVPFPPSPLPWICCWSTRRML